MTSLSDNEHDAAKTRTGKTKTTKTQNDDCVHEPITNKPSRRKAKKTKSAENETGYINDDFCFQLDAGKEIWKMMTKTFEPKEMLPFSQLRTLNQKDMLNSLEENDKLGIVIKDQLKVAMIDMDKYEKMVDALQEYERLLDWLDERDEYERIHHRLESDRVVEYKEGMSLLDMAGVHLQGR